MEDKGIINTTIKRLASNKEKNASNKKRAKAIILKFVSNVSTPEKEIEKYLRNYGLLNGYVDPDKYEYTFDVKIPNEKFKGKIENFTMGYKKIRHHPLIMTIKEDIAGIESEMPLSISVRAMSPEINNQRIQELENRIMINFNRASSSPLMKQAEINNIKDNLNLGLIKPDEAEIQAGLISMDVEELDTGNIEKEVMEEYKIPLEVDGQKLLDFLKEKLNIRAIKSDSLMDILATYSIYIRVGIERGMPIFERMNPCDVSYIPSPHSPDVEKSIVFIHKQVVSFQQALAMDGDYFDKDNIKALEDIVKVSGTGGYSGKESIGKPVDYETVKIAFEYSQKNEQVDHYSPEGQEVWKRRLMEYASNPSIDLFAKTLERRYITWMDYRKWKKVERDIDGKIEVFYHSEHYTENPETDISVTDVEFPEPWHAVMYGTVNNAEIIKVGPVEYPKINPEKPWDQVLPVFGGKLNTMDGKAKNRTPVDAAAEYNYEYDLFSEIYKRENVTNYGQVLSFVDRFKPDNMNWEDFFSTLHNLSVIHVDPYKEEFLDGRFQEAITAYRTLDLSKNKEIASIVNHLIYLEQRTIKMMLFSENASGNIGQYAKASNVMAAIKSTQSRLNNLFTKQQKVFKKALQYLFDVSVQYYVDNPDKISTVFSSADKMFKNLDWRGMSALDLGINIDTNPEELSKVEMVKNNLLAILQNSIVKDGLGLIDIIDASTMGRLREIAIKINERDEKRMQAEQQNMMQQQQFAQQAEDARFQRDAEFKLKLEEIKNQYDVKIAEIEVEKFAKTLDINKDGINDMNQLQQTKNEIELRKLEIDKIKVLGDLENKRKEIELKYKNNQKKLQMATGL